MREGILSEIIRLICSPYTLVILYVQDLVGDKQDKLTVYDCLCHL